MRDRRTRLLGLGIVVGLALGVAIGQGRKDER
jgi:hypothetical protein